MHIDSYSSIIVISEKATDVAVGVTRQSYLDNVYPTIIAPKGSAAWSQWQYSDEDPIKYIDSDSIIEPKGAQIRTRDNGMRFGFVLDESVFGVDLSQYKNLYKRINKEYDLRTPLTKVLTNKMKMSKLKFVQIMMIQ